MGLQKRSGTAAQSLASSGLLLQYACLPTACLSGFTSIIGSCYLRVQLSQQKGFLFVGKDGDRDSYFFRFSRYSAAGIEMSFISHVLNKKIRNCVHTLARARIGCTVKSIYTLSRTFHLLVTSMNQCK